MRFRPAVALVIALGAAFLVMGGAWLYLYSAVTGFGRARRMEDPSARSVEPARCLSNADCAEGTYCTYPDAAAERAVCTPDRCEPDGCGPYFACRVMTGPRGHERGARSCMLAGEQKEGQPCVERPHEQTEACLRELLCVDQVCRRPCDPAQPSSCPTGFACRDTLNGPACAP